MTERLGEQSQPEGISPQEEAKILNWLATEPSMDELTNMANDLTPEERATLAGMATGEPTAEDLEAFDQDFIEGVIRQVHAARNAKEL